MNNSVATAMALALVAGVVGLSAVPVAAVVADCNDEFKIPDSKPATARVLLGSGAETGLEDVADPGNEEVTVELASDDDELRFGIFVFDSATNSCLVAQDEGLSDCGSDELLTTKGSETTDSKTCTIEAPDSGTENYYVHVVNQESDPLDYFVWMSA